MKNKRIFTLFISLIVAIGIIISNIDIKAATFKVIEEEWSYETALERTDENWEFQVGSYRKDGKLNLYSIKKQAGNHTKIHIMSSKSEYGAALLEKALPVEATGSDVSFRIGDYNGDGYTDLYMIKKQVGNHTEIHVLDGANEFQTFLLQKALPVEATDSTTDFEVGDYNGDGKDDLYMIKKQVVGKTEVHVMKAENGFSDFYFQGVTSLPSLDDNWEFGVSDYNNDGKADLYCINKKGSDSTEVNVLDGSKDYTSFLVKTKMELGKKGADTQFYVVKNYNCLIYVIDKQGNTNTEVSVFAEHDYNTNGIEWYNHVKTKLERTDENWEFQVGSYRRDGKNNLYSIKKQAGNHTKIYIMSESSNYQTFILEKVLPVEATGSDVSFRIGDYNGDGYTDLYMIKKQVGNHTEIHVLDGANEFQTFILQRALPVEATDSTTDFEVGDYNGDGKDDLYMIKKQVVGKTEVHVMKAENGFSDFYFQGATSLPSLDDNWEFGVSDYDNDGKGDLYCIDKNGGYRTRVTVLSANKSYKDILFSSYTPIEPVGKYTQFCVTKDKLNIFAIHKQSTDKTEVHAFKKN